ncbi:hypothetical protein [Rhodoferax ferrireducens]|uniref:hypothetical protein n=1 Tax=Rhodoferax ferrireducens TaxID=192843 RepID=UPI000E0D1492|nr:hypothetical protein [Rhodoferax ferrireducens]
MKHLKFTYVDAITGVSAAVESAMNGTRFPSVAGLEFVWARESAYPTPVPEFFGTCPDASDTDHPGVMGVFSQSDWDQMLADEMRARPDPESKRVAALWQAAHEYEYAQVSGSAIGLLAIGVLQKLPKCAAVQGWIKEIWVAYYERKATGSTDTDFSIAGACPHSVPELMQELGL